jgi:flagellar protein FlbD
MLTRLNGPRFAVNPDLLERVDTTPDTVLTLLDGTKYVVLETVEEVISQVRAFRASVIAEARTWDGNGPIPHDASTDATADQTGDGLAPAVPLRRSGRQ